MECQHVQEEILESFDGPSRSEARWVERSAGRSGEPSAVRQREIDAHLAGCPACAQFAARHQALDARLTATLVPPALSPTFRPTLQARIRQEAPVPAPVGRAFAESRFAQPASRERRASASVSSERSWLDTLPDIVHFASFGAATIVCVIVQPASAPVIVSVGTTASLFAYFLMTSVRHSLEAAEQPDR